MKKVLTIAMITCAVLTVVVYASSCHCADPIPPSPGSAGEGAAGGVGGGVATHRSAILRDFSSEAEMNRWNRGYGATEDTSISAGAMRRTLGLMNYGLTNARAGVEGWHSTTDLPFNRYQHASVVLNGFVYVIGGCSAPNCAIFEKSVLFARVNADGTMGSWSLTTDLPANLYAMAAVAHNGRIYVTGGTGGTVDGVDTVYVASVNPDGTVIAWTAVNKMPVPRQHHASVAYNGYLYVLGGENTIKLGRVDFTPIKSDGTLGTWAATFDLPNPRTGHSVAAYDGFLYVTGHDVQSTLVQTSKINADGTLNAWSNSTSLPGAGRIYHSSVAYNGNLYVSGGISESNVLHVPINPDGSLGAAWNVDTGFGDARHQHTSIVHDGFLYVIGGGDPVGNVKNTVKFAPIRPDGSVGTTWVKGSGLSAPIMGHAAAVFNGFAYVTGGCAESTCSSGVKSSVSFAPILPDGTTGQWQPAPPFSTARWMHAAVAHRGYLYVAGGCTTGACAATASVEYAPINPDGTLGNWAAAIDLPATRFSHTMAAHEGRLYVAGGDVGGTPAASTLFITQNVDGSLSAGGWSPGTNLPEGRKSHATVIYNSKLYVIGGATSAVKNTVYLAAIKPDGSLDTWGSTTALPAAAMSLSAGAQNGLLYVAGGEDGAATTGAVYAARLNPDGTISPGMWSSGSSVAPTRLHAGFSHGGYLFVAGGCRDINCQTMTPEVLSAPFNGNGEFSEPQALPALPSGRSWHSMAAWKRCVYVTGGHDGTGPSNTVYQTIANPDGSVSGWSAGQAFASPRWGHKSIVINGYLYVIGGYNNVSYLRDVQVTSINEADCSLNGWTGGQQLPEPLAYLALAAYNGRIYAMGGFGGSYSAKVYYATVDAGGSLSAWTAATNLPTPVSDLEGGAHGGFLYAIGGENGSNPRDEVLFAKINADGSTGTWTPTTPLVKARYAFASVLNNGFIYVFGGTGTGGPMPDIDSAPLNADGSVGPWAGVGALPSSEYRLSAAAHNGWAFTVGGAVSPTTAASARLTSQQASLKSHGTALFDMGVGTDFNWLYINGRLAGPGSQIVARYRFAPQSGIFGDWSAPTEVKSLQGQLSLGANFGRYIEIAYTLDDNGKDSLSEGRGTSEIFGFLLDFTPLANGGFCGTDPNVCVNLHCVGGICCDMECSTQHQCMTATCATGTCQIAPKPQTTQCNDGNPCTNNDTCSAMACESTLVTCTTDANCPGSKCIEVCAGTPYTCTPGDCHVFANCDGSGGCTYSNQNPGTMCTDTDTTDCLLATCDDSGNCTQGATPAPENSQCAGDASVCTDDYCDAVGACSRHPVREGACLIDGVCRNENEYDGTNACRLCDPFRNATDWVNATAGSDCPADAFNCTRDVCDANGQCTHPVEQGWCLIAGQCVAGGTVNPDNSCQYCAGSKPDGWTNFASGNTCEDKDPCTKDSKCDPNGNCGGGTFDPNLPGCKCTSDAQCTVAPARHCNLSKGQCVECVQDAHCGTGKSCNQVTFTCETERCQNDNDCTDPSKEHCRIAVGECVQCYIDSHCGAGKKCNTITFSCEDAESCTTDAECRLKDPDRPVCGADGTCVQCEANPDCADLSPPKPVCNPDTSACVQCVDDNHCKNYFPDTPACIRQDGVCVECTNDTHCAADGMVCDRIAFRCVPETTDGGPGDAGDAGKDTGIGCTANAQCGGATPVCNIADGVCVECMESSTCVIGHPGKIYCSNSLHKCVECLTSFTCGAGKTCDTSTGTCVGGGTGDVGTPENDGGQSTGDGGGAGQEDAGGANPAGEDAGEAPAEGIKNPYGCMCATVSL